MNWEAVGAIGETLGAAGVIVTLGYLAFQIRQNTKANRASTLQMNADYWLTYCTTLADDRFSALYAKGALGRDELDDGQFGQFFLLCRATFMGCENQHYQYRAGMLDEDAYRGYEATIREQITAFPGIRAMWQLVKHTYGSEFVTFLDVQIAKTPTHDRGSMQKRWRGLLASTEQESKKNVVNKG